MCSWTYFCSVCILFEGSVFTLPFLNDRIRNYICQKNIPVTLLHSLMDKSYKVSDVVSIVTRLMRWQHLVSTALTQSINARSYALQVLTSTDFITWSTSAFIERIKAVETRCCRCINRVMTDTTSVSKVLKIQMDSSNSGWTVSFEHHCTKQQQQ